MAKFLLWCLLTVIWCGVILTQKKDNTLRTCIVPTHYHILFTFENSWLRTKSFSGIINIYLTVNEKTPTIILNSRSLHIIYIQLFKRSTTLAIKSFEYRSITEQLSINMKKDLEIGSDYRLFIKYRGLLDSDQTGFYVSSYSAGPKRAIRYFLNTSFKPNYARRAFPSFDEPKFRTTFNITLKYPSNLRAISNTAPLKTYNMNGQYAVIFAQTPNISTSSLAITISDFVIEQNQLLQYWSGDNNAENRRNFSLEVSPKIIRKLEYLTNISYDQLINKDLNRKRETFPSMNEAVSNFNEDYMFDDDSNGTNVIDQIQISAKAVVHCVNYWFNNLITVASTTDAYLNAALRIYYQYLVLDSIYPELGLDQELVIKSQQRIFRKDGLISSVAFSSVQQQLDKEMIYLKGVSIIRMMALTLNNTLKDGITKHLKRNLNGNKTFQGLYDTLRNEPLWGNAQLGDLMDNWMNKPGYPLITVMFDNNFIVITQKRFLYEKSIDSPSDWYVPITFTIENKTNQFNNNNNSISSYTIPQYWLTPNQSSLRVYTNLGERWIIVNNMASGYYRVNYDYKLWIRISEALKRNIQQIPDLNRAQLVDDIFNLARSKETSYKLAFNLLDYLVNETSYFVWFRAFENFKFLIDRTSSTELKKAISDELLYLMDNFFKSVPLNKTNFTDQIYTLKQVMAYEWACNLNQTQCIKDTTDAFKYLVKNPNGFRPNVNFLPFIYCTGLRHSVDVQTDWNFLWEEFVKGKSMNERQTLLIALGCTNNETILNTYLENIMTGKIEKQDAGTVFRAITSGTLERCQIVYNFFTDNYISFEHYFKGTNLLENIIGIITSSFTTQSQIDDFQQFIKDEDLGRTVKLSADKAIERAQVNINWRNKFEKKLKKIFNTS